MKQNRHILLLLTAAVWLTGCQYIQHRRQVSGAVAEVNGQYLYREELTHLTAGLAGEDSVRAAEMFIRQWASDILLYDKAKDRARPEIEALVEDYRRSLYVHDYEQHYIAQRMPKTVADTLVQQFYNEHKEQFILEQSIVRGLLIVVPNGAPDLKKLRQWLGKLDEDNLEKIEKYAYSYASGYELFTDQWRTDKQLQARMPFEQNDPAAMLRRSAQIEVQDSLNTYILQVSDKHLAGETMPVEYARPEIEKILLLQRQTEYLQRQRDELYQDALRFNHIHLYDDED